MTWGELGCNALQIVFILLIFWGIIIRLNRIEGAISQLRQYLKKD